MEANAINATPSKLEIITSKAYLDRAFDNAKAWCSRNLSKWLDWNIDGFDYSIFNYVIDNSMINSTSPIKKSPMFAYTTSNTIYVSTHNLQKFCEKEEEAEQKKQTRNARSEGRKILITGGVEVDLESLFVHELTELIVYKKMLSMLWKHPLEIIEPHDLAYMAENINRRQRGLKERPFGLYYVSD